jgi:ABC-2 type transport system permease protein
MLRQILLLCRPAFINLMGVNEARYGRDPAKRRRQLLLFAAFAFLGVVAVLYVGAFCVGLGVLGLARAIPGYMAVVLSLVVLIFTFFKAGPLILTSGFISVRSCCRLRLPPLWQAGFSRCMSWTRR